MAPSAADFPAQDPVPFIDLTAQYRAIAADVRAAVERVFESQQFVLGQEVETFEAMIARLCDSRFAIGCASGTDALILSLMAHGIGPGDEVITSPFSFFATASSIVRVGATPVFVDIDPTTFNMNSELVEAAITERTRAIMPVHLFGQCADMEPLWRLAVRHKLAVIEDACQAIGASYRGRRAGVLGSLGCFSFFPTKNLGGAGDGGIITTDDADLANTIRRLRVHGDVGGYQHVTVGLNSRLDALQAAVLAVKVPLLAGWTDARRSNARRYGELLRHYGLLDAVQLPCTQPDNEHVYNQYSVRIRGGRRDEVVQALRDQEIGCAVYYPTPLHVQECFAELGYQPGDLPESETASAEILSLPIYSELSAWQQETVVRGIATALGRLTGATRHLRKFGIEHSKAA